MKMLVLYRSQSEHGTKVESFLRDFRHQYEIMAPKIEVLEYDSREGMAEASLYDIMQAPAIMVLADDGSVLGSWTGDELPMLSTVASYLYGSS
jgi:hypothetical protein